MKRIGFIILAVFIIFTGCYDGNDTAKVRINLGNIHVAQNVMKKSIIDRVLCFFSNEAYAQSKPSDIYIVDVAAFNGKSVIATASFDATDTGWSDTVELSVPAGNNIKIIVIGEYTLEGHYAQYYGFSTVDLQPGTTTDVAVNVYGNSDPQGAGSDPSWTDQLNLNFNSDTNILSWSDIGIPVKFQVYYYNSITYTNSLIYEGYDTQTEVRNIANGCDSVSVYLNFEQFNVKTQAIADTYFGCK